MPDPVIDWLLDENDSDPAIRWQVMRDLLDAPEEEWSAERARVETDGWGAALLALEDDDGQWDGGAFFPPGWERNPDEPGQPWTTTAHTLTLLRELGLVPGTPRVNRMVELIDANCRWDHAGQPFWEGEVEPCINGRALSAGAYFGVDMTPVVDRLVDERLVDGGWNCNAEFGSVRSSFDTTINVLEGLWQFGQGGDRRARQARLGGEEYLLERQLFRRLSTGLPADEAYLDFHHPNFYRYDILRGLDHFRSTGKGYDPRMTEAIDHLRSRRSADGTWPLDRRLPGRVWFNMDGDPGEPSRWITLRALRVLRWWDGVS